MPGATWGACSRGTATNGFDDDGMSMTGNLFQLPGAHREIEALLPWHVTGQLDAADGARVAAHLEACGECRGRAETERQLAAAIVREPADADTGWARLRERLDLDRPAPAAVADPGARRVPWFGWRWIGWGVGAQLSFASLVGAFLLPVASPASFHALGTASKPAAGNVIVMFYPDTREQELRRTLRANSARLVDGPTAANAYVVEVAGGRREQALAALRDTPAVMLAEPLDGNIAR